MDEEISNNSNEQDVEMKENKLSSSSPTVQTTPTKKTSTPTTKKRKTAAEKEEEKKKKEEEKKKKEEEKKKKEEEKTKKAEDKKKRDEEKSLEKKKKEEELERKKEEREAEKKKKEEEKKRKEEELEKKKEEKEEEKKRKEEEKKKKEDEKREKQEIEQRKQPKLTQFFAAIEPSQSRVKSNSSSFIQPVEMAPFTEHFLFQIPTDGTVSTEEEFQRQLTAVDGLTIPKLCKDSDSYSVKAEYFKSIFTRRQTRKTKFVIKQLQGSIIHHDVISKLSCIKLLKFHDDSRPAYYGTYSKKSKLINGRRPFRQDTEVLDYNYDSGDEWEDVEEAENLSSDAEQSDESEDEEMMDEQDKNWIDTEDEDENDSNINTTTTTTSTGRKSKKRRTNIEEKKAIVLNPYFNPDTDRIDQQQILEFSNQFTIESLEPNGFPIKLDQPISQSNSNSSGGGEQESTHNNKEFPPLALPTLIKFITDNKLKQKEILKVFHESFPQISQRSIKEKILEYCIYSNKNWTLKPEHKDFLSNHTVDPFYPIPIAPTTTTTNNDENNCNNNNNDNQLVDNNKSPNVQKSKTTTSKKKQSFPTQSNTLLNYFTKIDQSPSKSDPK
eukprot:gene11724-14349_t